MSSRDQTPVPKHYKPGKIPCIRCGRDFESWDRKKNRMCSGCKCREDDFGAIPDREVYRPRGIRGGPNL